MILRFYKTSSLFAVDESKTHARLSAAVPDLLPTMLELCHVVQTERELTPVESRRLRQLLSENFELERLGQQPVGKDAIEVGPRLAFTTADCTNAVSICQACSFPVTRLETTRRWYLMRCDGAPLTDEQRALVIPLLYDRMTEQHYQSPLVSFEHRTQPEPVKLVPILRDGMNAIRSFNDTMGTAFDDTLSRYICEYCSRIGRDMTDVELFMDGQLNSNHCRHFVVKADLIFDGKPMPHSIFGLIKATTKAHRGRVLSAYADNAAVIQGFRINRMVPVSPVVPGPYAEEDVDTGIVMKVETHNHPTAIEPYGGAGTGLGGVIRDPMGTGCGAIPLAATAQLYTGNWFIDGYVMPWEKVLSDHPRSFATPLQIAIEGSNGSSDYGNQFGIPVVAGTYRTFDMMVDGHHYGYIKPVGAFGCSGIIDVRHVEKGKPEKGFIIIHLGGERHRIGVGGGSGSSKDGATQDAGLDWNSVQRPNGEMENKGRWVIQAFVEMGNRNPIVTITDSGAGGQCVAGTEIAEGVGAVYELRAIPNGDKSMNDLELYCNESQECMLIVIRPESLKLVKETCARFRCPMSVIGEITGDGRLVVTDRDAPADAPREQRIPIDLAMDFLLGDLPTITIHDKKVDLNLVPVEFPDGFTVRDAVELVQQLPSVSCKEWLTGKVDHTVGANTALQQNIGPHQLPLADCAVISSSFLGTVGYVKAIGEQPIKGIVNPAAGARMSLAEAVTNMVFSNVESFGSISFSATWQWPCGQPGEMVRFYDATEGATGMVIDDEIGQNIPVGKDSTSMTAKTTKDGKPHAIKAPGTVQIVAFAPCPDIRNHVTPDIKRPGESRLALIDIAGGKRRLGGSALAQVLNQVGNESPDVDDKAVLRRAFEAVQEMLDKDLILAGHDSTGDGGPMQCVLEMAYAGDCGLELDVKPLNDVFKDLFAEEAGIVIEYLDEDASEINAILGRHNLLGIWVQDLGRTRKETLVTVRYGGELVFTDDMRRLRQLWRKPSYKMERIQGNPETAEEKREAVYDRPGMKFSLSFNPSPTPVVDLHSRPRVAILMEEGTNGHREMAGAFRMAGFDAWPVHMTDITEGRISLDAFRGAVDCGGFSYNDVLGAGKGWAGVAMFNDRAMDELQRFRARSDTFMLGVCNGAQKALCEGLPPWNSLEPQRHPRFVRNASTMFEHQFVSVRVEKSPCIFFRDMEGSVLGIIVAHGEGRCIWPDGTLLDEAMERKLIPLRFVDDNMEPTERYPFNPNGSKLGVTALCSPDGRFLAMMPHPERLFQWWQWPYWPQDWKFETSPWLKFFQNVYDWCKHTS